MQPGSKRSPAGTPDSSSRYPGEFRGNAAPFAPAPTKYIDSGMVTRGGPQAIPSTHSGRDETGTGKCGEA